MKTITAFAIFAALGFLLGGPAGVITSFIFTFPLYLLGCWIERLIRINRGDIK